MKATDLLKTQHTEVKGLLHRAERSEDGHERQQLVEQIIQALQLHTQIEEELFYPAVRALGASAADLVDEAYEEHHVVDLVISEMADGLDVDDERFCAKITVLKELVEHHIEEEETELFATAQQLGDEKLTELGAQMEAMAAHARAEELEETAPHRPHNRRHGDVPAPPR